MANNPYSQVVGSIMYLLIFPRLDLSYSSSLISGYMANPSKGHWEVAKWVLRHLKRWSMNAQLIYKICPKELFELYGFVDYDYAGDLDKRRSLTWYCSLIGGNLISWKVLEVIWLKGLVKDFGIWYKSVKIYCDNQSTIHLSKNQHYHSRIKHIDNKFHFIK